ncbi:hypothetical protein ECBCE034MS14_0291 [Escherichia coli BCE034_MS-14]|nr:hypothetical protein ECBCE034MS14_0291 [Escherichia coli BCE034_MS-14]
MCLILHFHNAEENTESRKLIIEVFKAIFRVFKGIKLDLIG